MRYFRLRFFALRDVAKYKDNARNFTVASHYGVPLSSMGISTLLFPIKNRVVGELTIKPFFKDSGDGIFSCLSRSAVMI